MLKRAFSRKRKFIYDMARRGGTHLCENWQPLPKEKFATKKNVIITMFCFTASVVISLKSYNMYYSTTVPLSNRNRFCPMSIEKELLMLGLQHENLTRQLPEVSLPSIHPQTRFAQEMLDSIVSVADEFFQTNRNWEVALVRDANASATSIPGLIVLPQALINLLFTVSNDRLEVEGMLAAAVGHEVGHAMGRHAAELIHRRKRVNEGLKADLYLHLPAHRDLELEADLLALHFMHAAGYDMEHAFRFWNIMMSCLEEKNASLRAYLGEHPPTKERLLRIREQVISVKQFWREKRKQERKRSLSSKDS